MGVLFQLGNGVLPVSKDCGFVILTCSNAPSEPAAAPFWIHRQSSVPMIFLPASTSTPRAVAICACDSSAQACVGAAADASRIAFKRLKTVTVASAVRALLFLRMSNLPDLKR